MSSDVGGLGRGQQLELVLMAVLRSGPAHGYTVIQHVNRLTDGTFDLAEGTVYPALHRLEAQGLLESEWAQVNGRRRRVYRLTKKGRRSLGQQEEAWQRFVVAMQGVLGDRALRGTS